MEQVVVAAGVVLVLWVLSCLLMMLFASRLPEGLLHVQVTV